MKTDKELLGLIEELKKRAEENKVYGRMASDLSKPSRQRREVNLTRINRFTKEGEMIIVPGKVLGGGELDHKLTISAFKFSEGAMEKITKSGSSVVPINELMKENIAGKRVRIIG